MLMQKYLRDNFEGIRLLKELLLEEDKDLETLHLLGQTYKTLGNFRETERHLQ